MQFSFKIRAGPGLLHAVGRRHAHQVQRAGQHDLRRLDQLEPGAGHVGIIGDDPALFIEGMEDGRQLLRIKRQVMRLMRGGYRLDDLGYAHHLAYQGQLRFRGQQRDLAVLKVQAFFGGVLAGCC